MKHILSFSGGKDSTYLAIYLVENSYPLDEAVMFDTGWEFPQMYKHIEKMRAYLENHNVELTVLKPKRSFDYLMTEKLVKERNGGGCHYGYSWCGLKGCRWGTTEKTAALDEYSQRNDGAIVYIGIAADEPERLEKERKLFKRFPLVDNGITEAECLTGCYERVFTCEGLYEKLDRVSCKFCSLKNLKELRNNQFDMPQVWEELREKQKLTDKPYKGDGKSVFQLETRFKLEKERQDAGLSITNREFYSLLTERLKEAQKLQSKKNASKNYTPSPCAALAEKKSKPRLYSINCLKSML